VNSSTRSGGNGGGGGESFLYVNLKKQVKELQEEVQFKTAEIEGMKKNVKYTAF